jgi:hypothetical protein
VTSTPLNSRATTGRCWMWQQSRCSPTRQSWTPSCRSRRRCVKMSAPATQRPPAASEAAEGVLGESAAVVMSPPSPAREGTGASLPQPVETVVATPATSVVDAVEGDIGGAGPSLPRPVAALAEEVLVPSQPATVPHESDAPEGTTRAASSEI